MATTTKAAKAAPQESGKSFRKAGAAPKLKVVKAAEPVSEMADWAAGLPEEFQECRLMRHLWRPYTVGWEEDSQEWRQKKQCAVCESFRTQWVDAQGYLSAFRSTRYEYAEGYQAPKGTGYWDQDAAAVVRLASIQRELQAS